ncbi:hypothetical protein RchiOBHm_Chr3g0471991 [Rosa chinensis]|uniref:Uncharacterized protein n=1 Tax=Rosa chinensis TaxID=74649 RepID=A0A2P6RBG5_ROSCH|nr:hypothetical protein RchiOBHm_Chr3g0471991 [Rosa chinensis]
MWTSLDIFAQQTSNFALFFLLPLLQLIVFYLQTYVDVLRLASLV